MRTLPAKLLGAFSDATIGAAIVMVHLVLADRDRARAIQHKATRARRETAAKR